LAIFPQGLCVLKESTPEEVSVEWMEGLLCKALEELERGTA